MSLIARSSCRASSVARTPWGSAPASQPVGVVAPPPLRLLAHPTSTRQAATMSARINEDLREPGRGRRAMAEDVINVFLADDNLLVREGVRALLQRQADLDVVGVAADY